MTDSNFDYDQPDLPDDLPMDDLADAMAAFTDSRDQPLFLTGCRRIPFGFSMTPRGLSYQAKDDPAPLTLTLAPFDVLGRIADTDGANPGTLIAWKDDQGRELETVVPDTLLHSQGALLLAELARRGLRCIVNTERQFKLFFCSLHCHRHLVRAEQPGWQADGAFLLGNGDVLGQRRDGYRLVNRSPDRFQQQGDLASWQQHVAELALGNSRLVYSMAHAFVGPLLRLIDEPFCASHIEGASSTGKSSALAMAGSVWGRPDSRDQVKSWRATDNAMEGSATAANDGLLLLDELGEAPPDSLRASVYMLANGFGKARASQDGSARAVKSWRLALLSTGERSPEDIIRANRQDSPVGLDVRLISIPADAGAGMGLFETLHGRMSAKEFADDLRHQASQHYGAAGRQFLNWLIACQHAHAEFGSVLRDRVRALADDLTMPGGDGQIARVMTKAALIVVAGELAIEAGVLPWPREAILAAVRACLTDWQARRGTTRPREEADVLRKLAAFVAAHGASRFEVVSGCDLPPLPVRDRAGWVHPGRTFLFTTSAFAEIVAPASKKFAGEVLHRAKLSPRPGTVKTRINGIQARCYEVSAAILLGGDDAVDHVAEAQADAPPMPTLSQEQIRQRLIDFRNRKPSD